MTAIGKSLIKNLKYCRELIDKGYNVTIVYPYSKSNFEDHIKKILDLNGILKDLDPEFIDEAFGLIGAYHLSNNRWLGFKGEHDDYFKSECTPPHAKIWLKSGSAEWMDIFLDVRYDFDPDEYLAKQILDS